MAAVLCTVLDTRHMAVSHRALFTSVGRKHAHAHFASLSLFLFKRPIFPGGPGLAGSRMFPLWILLELRTMVLVVTTVATRRATSKKPTSRFLQVGCSCCGPTNSVKSLKGKLCTAACLQSEIRRCFICLVKFLYSMVRINVSNSVSNGQWIIPLGGTSWIGCALRACPLMMMMILLGL